MKKTRKVYIKYIDGSVEHITFRELASMLCAVGVKCTPKTVDVKEFAKRCSSPVKIYIQRGNGQRRLIHV